MKWYFTGDCHRNFTKFKYFSNSQDPDTAVVILGDASFNIDDPEQDSHVKNAFCKRFKCRVYCVYGNHEQRPEKVKGMTLQFDPDVNGFVWIDDRWPQIRFFRTFGLYEIGGYTALVLGGAYSVDKNFRIQNNQPWFPEEQLSFSEKEFLSRKFVNTGVWYDFILSHTCPYSWRPMDLFLGFVDQSKVDNSMENFLEKVKNGTKFSNWLFGHFHGERIIEKNGFMVMNSFIPLEFFYTKPFSYT